MNSAHLSGIELKGLWKEFKNRKKTWDKSREIETVGGGKREWNEQGKIKMGENWEWDKWLMQNSKGVGKQFKWAKVQKPKQYDPHVAQLKEISVVKILRVSRKYSIVYNTSPWSWMHVALRKAKVFSSFHIFFPHSKHDMSFQYSEAEVRRKEDHNSRPSGSTHWVIIIVIITKPIHIVGN